MKNLIKEFFRQNWIILFTALAILLFELVSVAITSSAFYIQKPWILFSQIILVISFLYALRTQLARYIVSIVILSIYAVVDLIFIVVYEMTGQIFDYTMLELKNDAFGILESVPINVTYFFVVAIIISAFIIFGGRYLRVYEKRLYKFNRNRVLKFGIIIMAGILLYFSVSTQVSYRNFYDEMLYSNTDNSYKKMGITSNFLSQIYESKTKKNDKEMNELELTSFLYDDNQIKMSNFKENYAKKYNVITILCESFEWMSFVASEEAFPNGLKFKDPSMKGKTQEELSRELFPNLYRLMEESTVFSNFHSKEKTDISENYSYLGVYPTSAITNYDFYQNTMSMSMANTLKALDKDITCNIFHNGTNSFYNRVVYEKTVGFDNYYAYNELLKKKNFTDWMSEGERNLDSELISSFSDEIMPTDKRFYSYIITITGHGQYSYRKSLKPYYEKLSEYGLKIDSTKDLSDLDNSFITYVATTLEVDKMIGTLYEELENRNLLDNTVITLFGDHNCYYQGLSNYVKKIPENFRDQSYNYPFLYNVPCIMRVPHLKGQVIDKYSCTSDIVPSIYDVLGINTYGNMLYGNSIFSLEESVLYSRAYNFFMTENAIYTSLNHFKYQRDIDIYDLTSKTTRLVNKIKHIDQVFYNDYFAKNVDVSLKNYAKTYGEYYQYKINDLNIMR